MTEVLARSRNELRHEPIERRVRAHLGGEAAVDSVRAGLVWEPRRVVPSYAVPAEDVRAELRPVPARNGDAPGVLHPGIPFGVHTAAGEPVSVANRVGAGFRLADEDLAGHVLLDFAAFDAWYEEDEPSPRPLPPRRRPAERPPRPDRGRRRPPGRDYERPPPLRDAAADALLRAREDVRPELHADDRRTYCPYKGEASYWSVDAAGRRRQDLAWSYKRPLPDAVAIAGLVAFWDERVDVILDGERRARTGGPIAAALREEFGV